MPILEVKFPITVADTEPLETALAEAGVTDWGVYEDKPTASAWIAGYFEAEEAAQAAVKRLVKAAKGVVPLGEPAQRTLPDADWRESYKAHFKPWHVGPLHWVPEWERDTYKLPPGGVAVWLDPGLAFGTGNHETTRLCCERLIAFSKDWAHRWRFRPAEAKRARILDAGCGSGILAISAAQLGYDHIVGFDNDPEAVRVSRENSEMNGASHAITFFEGDLVSGLGGRTGDLVLANIQANILRQFARELIRAVAPGGWLVLSGILAIELEAVKRDFQAVAPRWKIETRTLGEWSDLKLVRTK